ncbi:hypothetical protein CRYUN_Cryun32bG0066500 [Craigia yunnanensis]
MEILSTVSDGSNFTRCLQLQVKGNANQALLKLKQIEQVKKLHFKNLAPPLVAALIALSPICNTSGGNTLYKGPTKNCLDTEEEIYLVTYFSKGRMPGFGESCTPRVKCTFGPCLKGDEIKILDEFVKLQADQGWPNIANGD